MIKKQYSDKENAATVEERQDMILHISVSTHLGKKTKTNCHHVEFNFTTIDRCE